MSPDFIDVLCRCSLDKSINLLLSIILLLILMFSLRHFPLILSFFTSPQFISKPSSFFCSYWFYYYKKFPSFSNRYDADLFILVDLPSFSDLKRLYLFKHCFFTGSCLRKLNERGPDKHLVSRLFNPGLKLNSNVSLCHNAAGVIADGECDIPCWDFNSDIL